MNNPAADLRAMRPVLQYRCIICGAEFSASDTRARYCSNKCKQRAKNQRKSLQNRLLFYVVVLRAQWEVDMKIIDTGALSFRLVLNDHEKLIVALGQLADDNPDDDGGAWADIAADLLADGCSIAEVDSALAAAGCENPAFVSGIESDLCTIRRALK